MKRGLPALALALALSATAQCVFAQAFCAAPHSSPSLTRAGVGTLLPGTGWLQLGAYHSRSSAFFGPDGETRPFLAEGETTTYSAFVTAAVGLFEGVEIWAQIPVHRLGFGDVTGDLSRVGIGDPRLAVRVSPAAFALYDIPITARFGLKLPGSDFPVDPNLLPLSEGQTDIEIALESGTILPSTSVHLVGWLGYRWRMRDERRDRRPGNELYAQLGVGGPIGRLQWELAFEALRGGPLEQQGIEFPGASRRLVQIVPTVGYGLGTGRIDVSARINVWGRNLPSGPAWTATMLIPWAW